MLPGAVVQSVLAPAGRPASRIHDLWSLMLWVATVVFVVTMAFVAAACARGVRRERHDGPASSDQALSRAVAIAVGATIVILFGLLISSVRTGRSVASLDAWSAVTIEVTGHQWWWEIAYDDAVPSRRVVTANELHVPVHRPVVLKVTSRDVIHSFWVPQLQGKRDLIPGYTTAVWLTADRPGTYRGQCAEFCGLQHAHMAFDIVAEPEPDFERWLDGMRQAAPVPRTDAELRGHDLFMTRRCGTCHTVTGTAAHGQVAPDLTHIATRSTIGAGTLPNTPAHLSDWVRDPQASKPGNQMPPNPLSPDEVGALLAYLELLK
jgi:cytochrome c oxidase subunit II